MNASPPLLAAAFFAAFLGTSPTLLSAQGRVAPNPVVPLATGPVVHIDRVDGPSRFTGAEDLVDFEETGRFGSLGEYLGTRGIAIELSGGRNPKVWIDPAPRIPGEARNGAGRKLVGPGPRPTTADHALRGSQPLDDVWPAGQRFDPGTTPAFLPTEPAILLTFAEPVSRVGFRLRSLDETALTLVVTVQRMGVPVGTHTYGAGSAFTYVGIESSRLFDELRVDFINPDSGRFSLDELRFEPDTLDTDHDDVPDFADTCPTLFDPAQTDEDGDGIGDLCDPFPLDPNNDEDGDGLPAYLDNCPTTFNPGQVDTDGDGIGDACDGLPFEEDDDGDGIPNSLDNCPMTYNPNQADCDGDGIGDVCDPVLVTPGDLHLTLPRGTAHVTSVDICLPPVPPQTDILIAIDTTASMLDEIDNLKAGIIDFLRVLQSQTGSELRYGLVTFEDYEGDYTSCGYSNKYGRPGDLPFRLIAPIGLETNEIIQAVSLVTNGHGGDFPESYGRVLWETWQPDSGIGFRPGAARIVIMAGDDVPHDCNPNEGLFGCFSLGASLGVDPGRDFAIGTADDVDFIDDAIAPLAANETEVVFLFSNANLNGLCAWEQWVHATEGQALKIDPDGTIPDELDVARAALEQIGEGHVELVEPRVDPSCPLIIVFNPPTWNTPIDVKAGGKVILAESIEVPQDLDPSITSVTCSVDFYADGAYVTTQTIEVQVP